MSQTFTEDCFAAGNVALTDLQNMENNFLALKTMFSGSSAPSNSTGGMPWFDTGKKLLKIRNSTNGAWVGILSASTAPRFWHYSNAAEDGWVVDSSVTDRVIAVKGGSNAYNTAGGGGAGTWTFSGSTAGTETLSHTHFGDNHVHSGNTIYVVPDSTVSGGGQYCYYTMNANGGSSASGSETVAHSHNISYGNAWRPLAAVGTMQYLDI